MKLQNNFYVILLVLTIFISCKGKEKEPQKSDIKVEKGSEDEPNIFVVKTAFPSKDGLLISADLYEVNGKKPTILLCHQAGYSRGEYKDTAIKLNKLGYSCMAMDQRSGKVANDIKNDTAERAKEQGLKTEYSDAKIDIRSAIDYVYEMNGHQPILLVGSSYSASLVLLEAKNNPKVKAVAAFSPGEYLKKEKLVGQLSDYKKPVFVTSSKAEIKQVEDLMIKVQGSMYVHFKPSVEGIHGSRALWKSTSGNEMYWKAFEEFLAEVF